MRRITPACAGKTGGAAYGFNLWQDHPRVCGENTLKQGFGDHVIGSPPRVRGKPAIFTIGSVYVRITPACAGKTLTIAFTIELIRDHPRVCGENR